MRTGRASLIFDKAQPSGGAVLLPNHDFAGLTRIGAFPVSFRCVRYPPQHADSGLRGGDRRRRLRRGGSEGNKQQHRRQVSPARLSKSCPLLHNGGCSARSAAGRAIARARRANGVVLRPLAIISVALFAADCRRGESPPAKEPKRTGPQPKGNGTPGKRPADARPHSGRPHLEGPFASRERVFPFARRPDRARGLPPACTNRFAAPAAHSRAGETRRKLGDSASEPSNLSSRGGAAARASACKMRKIRFTIVALNRRYECLGGNHVNSHSTDQQQLLRNALDLLHAALDVLDDAAAPAQIGAHVDLAVHQLSDTLHAMEGGPKITANEQSLARH